MGGAAVRSRPGVDARTIAAAFRSPWWAVGAITALAALLRLHGIAGTHTNPYYDAAVRSMGQSWHNFFFAAYEPGGKVAIDKPPVDLWLQVVSTKVFGLRATGLLLPEALAGTAAVPLLYDLVRRPFGLLAGMAAALAAAVMPASVLTARSDTMDSLMMAMTVLALWLAMLAIRRRQARWFYLAAVVAGLAFEVKLLEALVALPALVVLYAVGSQEPLRRRVLQFGIAGFLFVAAALWWPLAVSLAPGHKPYPLGSTNGSVWNSTFVFNGTDRLSGKPHPAAQHPAARHTSSRRHSKRPSAAAVGSPGPTRLISRSRARFGQIVGNELVAGAVLALLAVAIALTRPRDRDRRRELKQRRALSWALAAWIVPGVVVFSSAHELHQRYLEAITPAIAAALGIGLAELVRATRRGRLGALALTLGLGVSAAYAGWLATQGNAAEVVAALAAAGAAIALFAGAGARSVAARGVLALGIGLALVSLLLPPAARSVSIVRHHETDSGHPGAMPVRQVSRLSAYLRRNARGARYEVVSVTYGKVAPLIVHDGRPVIVAGNIARQQLITIPALRADVATGQVRYALFSSVCGRPLSHKRLLQHCPPLQVWIREHSVEVSHQAHLPSGTLFRFTSAGSSYTRS